MPYCHCWFEAGTLVSSGAVVNADDPDASLANAWQCGVTPSPLSEAVSITASAECIRVATTDADVD